MLNAPFRNTFGSTETGNPSASRQLIPIGTAPTSVSKTQSSYCQVRLVDDEDRDALDGTRDFVDRRKYLIKSGGENIYPAEIERLLLRDPRQIANYKLLKEVLFVATGEILRRDTGKLKLVELEERLK